ncbi:MAG: TlpA disulfide reductase family protein [Muribaculaceae bacterium]|nr:TlpA disulfide reductase family protein [Muribaculaceae bacterium]
MRAKLLVSICMAAILCACNNQSNGYVVSGVVNDSTANGKMVYIMQYDDQTYIDSTTVSNGKFVFKGKADTAQFCRLILSREKYTNLILENGNITVDIENGKMPTGSPLNEELAKIEAERDSIINLVEVQQQELAKKYTNPEELKAKRKEFFDEINKNLATRCKELYKIHNNDAIGFYLLNSIYLDAMEPEEREQIIASLGSWLKSTNTVSVIIKQIKTAKKTAEGQMYTDIKGKAIDGRPLSLSDFIGKGNYVLLDMWASWCGPCKGEIPNLAFLHNKYKNKGLTVVGLFVWDKESNLKKTIEAEKITWPQIIDAYERANFYGVTGIPFIILFDPDGKIIKRGLRGEEMIKTVEELLQNKK